LAQAVWKSAAGGGRVGEEAMERPSPLVEPDVQVSRIRLAQRISPQAGAGRTRDHNEIKPRRFICAKTVVPFGGR